MCCVTSSVDRANTIMVLPVRVNSSMCVYWCRFSRQQQRTSAQCGSGRPVAASKCERYTCDIQPDEDYEDYDDDEREEHTRLRRDADAAGEITIQDGVRCTCTCLNFRCNCANSTDANCHKMPTWICLPGTANFTGTPSM